MAVITPANLQPDALPRVRGVILTRNWRGLWIVAKWPTKRGPPRTWNQIWTSQQFAYAGRMAANPEPRSYETARFLTQGSDWLPRDVLTMAAYGKFYEVFHPDGTPYTQADHGPNAVAPPARNTVENWQPNAVNGVLAAANSTSSFAFKGEGFIPDIDMALNAVSAVLTPVNGGSYRAVLVAMNGSNVITAVTGGTTRVIAGTTKKFYEFDITASLVAGTRYAVMIGRTDGVGTYALPLVVLTGTQFLIPATMLGATRLAQVNPAVGQTVDVTTTGACLSLLLDF